MHCFLAVFVSFYVFLGEEACISCKAVLVGYIKKYKSRELLVCFCIVKPVFIFVHLISIFSFL